MYRIYDVKCEDCGNVFEVFINHDEQIPKCDKCNSKNTVKIYNSFNFKLKYNNKTDVCGWADNNYESSQYYRKIKEARARGENVKSPDND